MSKNTFHRNFRLNQLRFANPIHRFADYITLVLESRKKKQDEESISKDKKRKK